MFWPPLFSDLKKCMIPQNCCVRTEILCVVLYACFGGAAILSAVYRPEGFLPEDIRRI